MFPVATLKGLGPSPGYQKKDLEVWKRLMKKTIQLLAIGATVAMFTLPVAARNLLSQPEAMVQDQCTQENKDAWYASFIQIRKTDETKAYDIAKKYLTCA